jgi:hypothetical protein
MRGRVFPEDMPRIRRARGFRLYDEAGRRYVDLYQDSGAAVLGHRGPGTVRDVKDALSRGLGSALPSVYEGRLKKLLRKLFPDYGGIALFACLHRGLAAASVFLGRRIGEEDVGDPALEERSSAAAYWRPFLDPDPGKPDVLIPILPTGGMAGLTAVCFRIREGEQAPEGDCLPPFVLSAVLRALSGLETAERAENSVTRAVDRSADWRRRGPYVRAMFEAGRYPEVVRGFLRAGFLLNPFFPGPSIIPGELSPGEEAGLRRLFQGTQGG